MGIAEFSRSTYEETSSDGSRDGYQLNVPGEQMTLGLFDSERVIEMTLSVLLAIVIVDIVDIVFVNSFLRERHVVWGVIPVLRTCEI